MVVAGRSWFRAGTGSSGQPAQITGIAEEANYTMSSASEVISLCAGAADNADRFAAGDVAEGSATLSHRVVGTTTWNQTGTASTANGPYIASNSILVNNTAVSSTMQVTSASNADGDFPTGGSIGSGYVAAGRQHEGANRLDMATECRRGWTEVQFAIAFGSATSASTSYEFRITWTAKDASLNTVLVPRLTSASAASTDYTRTVTDVVTNITLDTVSRSQAFVRQPEDLVSQHVQITEVIPAVTKNYIRQPALDQLATVSDSLVFDIAKTPDVELVSSSDSTEVFVEKTPDDELVAASDSVAVSISLVKTDNATIEDGPLTNKGYTVEPNAELVSASDDATFALSIVHQDGVAVEDTPVIDHDDNQPAVAEETFTVSDSVSTVVAFTVVPEDTSVVSDSASSGSVLTINPDESLTISDSVLVAVSFGTDATATVSDSVLTDHDDNVSETPSESLTISDSVDTVISFAITPSDVVEVSEDVVADSDNAKIRQPSESVLIDDSVNLGLSLVTPDTGTVSDSVDASTESTVVREVEDSISAGDGTGIGIGIDVGDQFEIDDRGNLAHGRNPKEEVDINDAIEKTRQPKCSAEVEDSNLLDITFIKVSEVTASDSAVANKQQDLEEQISDEAVATDSVTLGEPERTEITATIVGDGGIDPNLMKEAQAVATIDVWNVALNALGISTLETTTGNNPQQTLLNNTFPLFRKQFLSDHLWNGAKKTADLTKLDVNTTDQSVANRWKYVYVLPTDCMRVWRLNGQENKPVHMGGNSKIYTNRWEIEVVTKGTTGGDTNTGKYRALCTNEDEARIEYVFDVGNDIDLLGPLTQHAMGLALAAFVATNFGKSANEIAQLEAQANNAITAAKGVDGQEGTPQMFGDTSLLGVRSIGY